MGPATGEGAGRAPQIPVHLGIIMDGNGRWARKRLLPRRLGHRAGAENLKRVTEAAATLGIRYLTVYAFSTENWKRPAAEVEGLMKLFIEFLERYDPELAEQDIRLRFAGENGALSPEVRSAIEAAQLRSAGRKGMQLIIAFNYGGRNEILAVCRRLAEDCRAGRIAPEAIDEAAFQARLYLPDVPAPDLILRTSGEMRLSNFMLWQAAYSELLVMDVLWPDFGREQLEEALRAYGARERRYGGLNGADDAGEDEG